MSKKNSIDIHTAEDLFSCILSNEFERSNSRIRGLIIVPGGGGKSTLVNSLNSIGIPCADIDQYWDQEKEKENVEKLIFKWKNACLDTSQKKCRHEIEDEYVLLKANLSKQKWLNENTSDILFAQTYRFHRSNLYLRNSSIINPPDDFDVCVRQWKENEEYGSYVLYDNFQELQRIVLLFHQFILSKR